MIKLSDYLNYLNTQIVQARKAADEEAIRVAKEYAKHEYLQYFKVPRYEMNSVKLNIPIKISDLNSETKYHFEMDEGSFIEEVNAKIKKVNAAKGLQMKLLVPADLKKEAFTKVVDKLASRNDKFVKHVDLGLNQINYGTITKKVIADPVIHTLDDETKTDPAEEMKKIYKEAFRNSYTPVSAKLNELFIDPDTSKEADKDKILLTLDVEMEEQGIRIHKVTDKDGKEVEEIIFE